VRNIVDRNDFTSGCKTIFRERATSFFYRPTALKRRRHRSTTGTAHPIT